MRDSANPGKKSFLLRKRNPAMQNETEECNNINDDVSLAGRLWLWRDVSFVDGVPVDCPQEIVARFGVWLSGVHDGEGSWVNGVSSLALGNGEKDCRPSKYCGPRG